MKEFTNSDNKNAGKQPQGVDSRTTKIWIPGKERAKTAALDQSGQQPAQTRKRPSQRKPAAQAQKPTAKQAAAQPTPASQPVRKRPAERKAAQQPVVSAIAAPAAKAAKPAPAKAAPAAKEAKPAPQKAPQTAKTKKAKEKKPVEKIDRKQLVRPQLPPQEEQLPTEQAAEAAAKDAAAHMAQEPKLEERIKKKIKRDIKARKKRVIVIPIIIASLLFLSVFGVLATRFMARVNLGTVENTYIHETTSFSLTLAWDAVENAEGYHVYQKKENSEDYQQIDSTENLYDIVYGLQQATTYSFYVKAYSGTYESRDFIPVENVYTIPNSGNITEIYSASSGTIHVGWQGNNRADGYLLEFRTAGRDYREENRIMIERTDSTEYNITSLKANDVIGVRVSSYFIHEGEKIFGEPSVEHEIKVSDGTSRHTEQARSTEKMIALTFDDGPLDGTSGDRILDVLEKYNAKATFYMVGSAVEGHQENVKRKAALGMELGNHSYSHDYYGDELPAEEIQRCSNAIFDACGQRPISFRSPGGITDDGILAECANEGMPLYTWSIDTHDWETLDADKVYHEVMDNVQDGDIVLMHEIYDSTADAVERMVPELVKQGYKLVTCQELVRAKTGGDPQPGVEYSDMR